MSRLTMSQAVLEQIRDRLAREEKMMREALGTQLAKSSHYARSMAHPSESWFPFACLWDQHSRAVEMYPVRDEEGCRFIPGQMVPKKGHVFIGAVDPRPYPRMPLPRIFTTPGN